jgi:secernin
MCDMLVALGVATDVGGTIFAKNSDRPPDEHQQIRWLPPRHDVGRLRVTHIEIEPHRDDTFGCLLTQPSWCWGAEHGVNTAGVAIGNEAIYTTLDPRSAEPALIGMDLVRLGLERGSSAAHAVDIIVGLLQRYGQGGACHDPAGARAGVAYWSSFLVADPVSAFVIETSGSVVEVEQVASVRAISNRTTIPSFDAAHRHPRQPVERLVDPRWHASNAMLAARPVSVPAMHAHLGSHASCAVDGWAVCMHAVEHGELVEVTASSMIATLVPDGPSIARVLLGHPCREQYAEVRIGDPFSMG